MVSKNPTSIDATGHFQFISVQGPDRTNHQTTKRLARSHAIKLALKNKRKLRQDLGDNFIVTAANDKTKRVVNKRSPSNLLAVSPSYLSVAVLDPFQTLAVDSSRLQTLLGDYKARQAPEPVFSVAEELAFQNFRSVFRTGLFDPALVNAVMLSLVFAATGGSLDRECLGYQGQAISHIRQKMCSLDGDTLESTIGAILLLAGVEARLGMRSQVQLHIGAVKQLHHVSQKKGLYLTGGIKRAIFWQDLNCSILTGSDRIVDHTTFAELQWMRDPFSPSFFQLPRGFQKMSHHLTKDFVEVLEDIHALQCIRDVPNPTKGDVMMMAHINSHIASIQSRLVGLQDLSPVLDCCRLAAYICSVMLCCTVWCALVIPSHVSLQLLRKLRQANEDPIWNDHPDLLVWVLYIGGAFIPSGNVRSDYILLLRSNDIIRFRTSNRPWPDLLEILRDFIWPEKAFMSQVKALWEETL